VTLRVPPGVAGPVALGRFALEYVRDGERHRLAFEESPRVARVASAERYFGSLDRPTWERGVIVDQYNALRRSVAEKVQAGRAADAVAEVQKYRADIAGKNEHVGSEAVARQLEEAAGLEKRLQDAAAGVAPMAPMETKQLRALGYVIGRPGSRK